MPRIALTESQKIQKAIKDASEHAKLECYKHGIKVKEIAEVTGVHYTAISHQFSKKNITLATYLAVELLAKQHEKGETL